MTLRLRSARLLVACLALAAIVAGNAPSAAAQATPSPSVPTTQPVPAGPTTAPVAPLPATQPLPALPTALPSPIGPTPPPAASPQPATTGVPARPGRAAPAVISVNVSGNVHVPTDRILAVVKTKVGQPFDENLVKQDLQAIFDLGYFSDQVPPLIRQRRDGIAITYRVVENPVVSKIVFAGNAHVPSDTLLALMDTAPGQVFNSVTFHQDVIRINSYYEKVGYAGQLPSHVANLSIDAKTGVVSIDIREGLTVKAIDIKGDPVLAPEKIRAVLSTKVGDTYSDVTRDKDYQAIKALYDKADLTIGDFEEGVDASSIDLKAGTATVDVTLSAARVGAVLITGNTRTHDIVIRRQLRERPGMLLLTNLVRADFDALTNLGYFEKVEPTVQPGPDPKKPAYVTLVWNVKEKRSGSINLGLGYSGGPNGAGLTGQFGFSNNNISGTGNGASFQYQKGSRALDVAASVTIPYLGDTPRKERYSIGGTLFVQSLTNFYQAYQSSGTQAVAFPPVISTPGPIVPTVGTSTASAGTIPVTLQPNGAPVSGLAADYITRASGVGVTLGRRFTPRLTATAGLNVQRLSSDVNVPLPYFVSGAQPAALANPNLLFNPFGTQQVGNSLGIIAPSIANTINGQSYNLHSVALGLISNTEDNYLDPRHGTKFSLNEEISSHNIGSAFDYTVTTLDFVRFFPILRASTFGIHGEYGTTTGSIPSTKLFILSDQQLRGYRDVFFGTDLILGQAELRVPVSADKKFGLAFFGDYGALRVRDAQPVTDQFGNVLANYSNYIYHGDVGVGIRFDVPQFGLFRLDFAKGKNGTHTSFGIGQSF